MGDIEARIEEVLREHSWASTSVLQGQYCNCGFNGDHRPHVAAVLVKELGLEPHSAGRCGDPDCGGNW